MFFASGCGAGLDTIADLPRFDVPEQAQRSRFLEAFPLLDQSGRETPAFGSSGKAFTGVLVYMPASGKGSYCTISHLRRGEVVTSAHCVDDDSDPSNYFVIFYDLSGQKQIYRIGNFIEVGSVETRDFARLRISNRAAREFATLDPSAPDLSSEVDRLPPAVHRASIWGYDPLKQHQEQFQRYGRDGMIAKRSDCDISRTRPTVVAVDSAGSRVSIDSSNVDPRVHIVVNNCTQPLVSGNSGSAITAYMDDHVVYGTHHWVIVPKEKFLQLYRCFEMTVNALNGNRVCVPAGQKAESTVLYGVGTELSSVLN